jgi:hypothetical protein
VRAALWLAVIGCGGATPRREPVVKSGPRATLNGNKLVVRSAVTIEDIGKVVVSVSTLSLTCEVAMGDFPERDGEVNFRFALSPRLKPDGGFGWAITDEEFENHSGSTDAARPPTTTS